MRRFLPLLAAAMCLAALPGCGEDSEAAPQGSPVERHGASAIDTVLLGEHIRARLGAASELYAFGNRADPRVHLRAAAGTYSELSPRVAAEDAALDREIEAGFDRVGALMARGATFDEVRDLLGPLSDQVIGGALVALVDEDARGDRGLEAEVVRRLMTEMPETFAEGEGEPRSLQYSYGLLGRSIRISRGLAESLGPRRNDVLGKLTRIREQSFPEGVSDPTPQPSATVASEAAEVRSALQERYGLDPE